MNKKPFVDRIIQSSCQAFEFKPDALWFEFFKEYSSKNDYPVQEIIPSKKEGTHNYIQGSFHFLDDDSPSDLYLVLSYFEELEIEFYTFWRETYDSNEKSYCEFIIWTPNQRYQF